MSPLREPRRRPAPDAPGIAVCHMSDCPDAVYVGRAWAGREATALGNPFTGDGGIARFRAWLLAAFTAVELTRTATPAQAAAVAMMYDLAHVYRELGRLELGCWCAPNDCHSDVIARAVIWLARRDAQYIRLGDGWARVDYDDACASEGLPFVVSRGGRVLRVCASLGQARETQPLARARQLQAVAV